VDFADYVLSRLPPRPSRVLFAAGTSNEVLESVIGMGYDLASEPPVRAAVVEDALRSDFDALSAISQIVRMIERGGVLIMSGIAWDLLDSATADWFFLQRRALAAQGGADAHRTIDGLRFWWRNELFADVPPHHELRWECHLSFEERAFEWGPGLHRFLAPVANEQSERSLIERGVIKPLGFRYVGLKRAEALAGNTPKPL
jgi:hypothetical protein